MIFTDCLLIFQHLFDSDYLELKVYDPNGHLYCAEYVDHYDIINHPHILFDNQMAVNDAQYKDIKCYDLDARNVFRKANSSDYTKLRIVVGTVKCIAQNEPWYYEACNYCSHKATFEFIEDALGHTYRCDKCKGRVHVELRCALAYI